MEHPFRDFNMGKKNYIFTNRNHPVRGVMSTIFGIMSWFTILLAIYLTYRNGGAALQKYGVSGILACLFGVAGLVLGILSKLERDKFYFFSYLGIGLNVTVVSFIGFIIYEGVIG